MLFERVLHPVHSLTAILKVAAACAAMCVPMLAAAQLQSLDSTRDGRGTLDWRTRVSATTVRRVRVVLHNNKRADITILSGASERFSGQWKSSGLTRVYLDIDRVGTAPAIGTGQITHDARGEFASLFLSGSVGSRKFDLKFDADSNVGGGGGGGGGGNRDLAIIQPREGATVDSGEVNIQGTSKSRSVNVRLFDSDGDLIVNDNVNVRNDRWNLRIRLDRGRYRAVVRDRNSRKTDEVSFRAGRVDIDEKEFKDNAKDAIKREFRGYEVSFKTTTVSDNNLGNRTVRGDFHVSGSGNRRGDYRMRVVCNASTARVVSVNYSRD